MRLGGWVTNPGGEADILYQIRASGFGPWKWMGKGGGRMGSDVGLNVDGAQIPTLGNWERLVSFTKVETLEGTPRLC